jgi:hypothetical protein
MDSNEELIPLPSLNLPSFDPNLIKKEGKLWIVDSIRKKSLILTPEEWVRQHWINFLINHLKYPRGLIALEKGMKYNQLQKRTDLVTLDRVGKPYLLIECKAPEVRISQKTMEQASVYHQEIKSEFLILSNGLEHIFLWYKSEENRFVQIKSCPSAPI